MHQYLCLPENRLTTSQEAHIKTPAGNGEQAHSFLLTYSADPVTMATDGLVTRGTTFDCVVRQTGNLFVTALIQSALPMSGSGHADSRVEC